MQLSEKEREAVIDTIMGEARGEGYLGMAAVAKAIANRSEVRGVSMAKAVGQKGQFDGSSYSAKSKDSKEREIAEMALDAVLAGEDPAQIGTADHFATNSTKTGWTEAYKDTAKTIGGHTFYSSPQALERAQYSNITATPQSKPDIPAMAMLGNAPATTNAFDAVLGTPQNEMRGRAAAVASGPPATPESLLGYNFSNNTVRDQAIQPDLAGIIGRSVQALGPEYGFSVTSGGQPATGVRGVDRVGSTRHDHGFAADGHLTVGGQGITPGQNFDVYTDLARQAGVQGALGFGHYGWGVHIDNARNGVWGPSTTSRDLDPGIRDAFNEGKSVREAGLYSKTGPTAKPDFTGGFPSGPSSRGGLTGSGLPGRNGVQTASVSAPGIQASALGALGNGPAHSATVTADLSGKFGPSKSAVLDGYREYANSRMGGLAPLDAPVDISARPEVVGPSMNLDGITATPSAKPGKDEGKGRGGFGKFNPEDPNELGALGKAAFAAGLMSNPAMAIGGLALSNLANGRPVNAGMGFGLGSKLGGLGGLGGLFGGFDGSPSVGTSALDYATGRALGNPNYTGMDFSRDFTNMGGMISNGRAAPGMVTAAEFNAAQREAGLAMGIMEGFSRDFGSAFGGLGGLGGSGSAGGNAGGKSGGKGGSSGRGGGKDESGKSGADGR